MKGKQLIILSVLFCFKHLYAQQLKQANWQQRVNYKIAVSLNDSLNTLSGTEQITYFNNSPDTLFFIYIHLWPNAYFNKQTPFAKQLLENGKTEFHFAPDSLLGRIDSLSFIVNGQKVKLQLEEGSLEIAKIVLPKALLPGDSTNIFTPFRVKLPQVFSRLGHENKLYCITQWYPKPAVYDVNGWNTMPYLDQGEFYSEFGAFDVSITTPSQYVVAATGDIQDATEKEWWLARSTNKIAPHPSTAPHKTLRFVQDNVHDFAWFASQRFYTQKSQVTLASGKKVETWLFTEKATPEELNKGVSYINEAVEFYSEKVGEYPYNIATVAVTPLKAGGGMEYPTITNVGKIDRKVIVHEVGHNWFYGILGTNERKYPWMDESINNYYESRNGYKKTVINHDNLFKKKENGKPDFSINTDNLFGGPFGLMETLYNISARNNTDQPNSLNSEAYTDFNYGAMVYGKASLAFNQLQQYLGDSLFDAMMQGYYSAWKFKHPLPDDFKQFATQFTQKNLDWFFNAVMGTTQKQDIKIKAITTTTDSIVVTLKNRGAAVPYHVQTLQNGVVVEQKTVEPFVGTQMVYFNKYSTDEVRVDAFESSIDFNRSNNYARTEGLFKTIPKIEIKWIANLEKPQKAQAFVAPAMGWNMYNSYMIGGAIYNSLVPRKKTEFVFTPMYATKTKDLAGYMDVQHRFLMQGIFQEIQVGLGGARFATEGYNSNQIIAYDSAGSPIYGVEHGARVYEKLAPRVSFLFTPSNPRTGNKHRIDARFVLAHEQKFTRSVLKQFNQAYQYIDLNYTATSQADLNEYGWNVNYQIGAAQSLFHKVTASYNKYLNYGIPKKGLNFRVFGGAFLKKPAENLDQNVYFRAAENNGTYDYLYDNSQFGRGETEINTHSVFNQQIMPNTNGFRTHVIGLGETDSWVFGGNFTSTIPGILPIRVFVDATAINQKTSQVDGNTNEVKIIYEQNIHYVTGVSLWLGQFFQVNFPVWADSKTTAAWDSNYAKRITFTLNLNQLNVLKQIREANWF